MTVKELIVVLSALYSVITVSRAFNLTDYAGVWVSPSWDVFIWNVNRVHIDFAWTKDRRIFNVRLNDQKYHPWKMDGDDVYFAFASSDSVRSVDPSSDPRSDRHIVLYGQIESNTGVTEKVYEIYKIADDGKTMNVTRDNRTVTYSRYAPSRYAGRCALCRGPIAESELTSDRFVQLNCGDFFHWRCLALGQMAAGRCSQPLSADQQGLQGLVSNPEYDIDFQLLQIRQRCMSTLTGYWLAKTANAEIFGFTVYWHYWSDDLFDVIYSNNVADKDVSLSEKSRYRMNTDCTLVRQSDEKSNNKSYSISLYGDELIMTVESATEKKKYSYWNPRQERGEIERPAVNCSVCHELTKPFDVILRTAFRSDVYHAKCYPQDRSHCPMQRTCKAEVAKARTVSTVSRPIDDRRKDQLQRPGEAKRAKSTTAQQGGFPARSATPAQLPNAFVPRSLAMRPAGVPNRPASTVNGNGHRRSSSIKSPAFGGPTTNNGHRNGEVSPQSPTTVSFKMPARKPSKTFKPFGTK